eukprot:2630451-Karenia_brevis.AAC.1
MNEKKEEQRQLHSQSLGISIHGEEGILELPDAALLDLLQLTLYVSRCEQVKKKVLQIVGGRW